MIKSNSFALLIGEGAEEELRKAVARVDRCCKKVEIFSSSGPVGGSRADIEAKVAILATDDVAASTLPIVHGLVTGEEGASHIGEFSLLALRDGRYIAERDILGTRQLFRKRGRLQGVASDFRFFDSGLGDLIHPGAQYSLASHSTRRRRRLLLSRMRKEEEYSLSEAASKLARLIDESTRRRVGNCRKVAVAFSGGLDSSLIAHLSAMHSKVTLCSVHVKGSRDEKGSERAAGKLGLELVNTKVDRGDVNYELKNLSLPFAASPMDKALWCVYSIAGRMARESDAQVLLLGQLADELFGGYLKYSVELQQQGVEAARRMMERDVRASSKGGFIRDEMACSRWIEPRFPFADEEVVRLALGLPVEYKIGAGERKRVLKRAALELGLPEELVMQPKKAAQYSSGIIKLV